MTGKIKSGADCSYCPSLSRPYEDLWVLDQIGKILFNNPYLLDKLV